MGGLARIGVWLADSLARSGFWFGVTGVRGGFAGRRARAALVMVCVCLAAVGLAPGMLAAVDQNRDGVVDVVDVQETVNVVLGAGQVQRPYHGDVDLNGAVDVVDVQVLVNEILSVAGTFSISTPGRVTGGVVGVPYSQRVEAYGGVQPYAWASSGTLPDGLVFSVDGVLSGTPVVVGTHSVVFEAVDGLGARVSRAVLVSVWGSFAPPVAVDETHYTPVDTPKLVLSPGVLGNDSCPLGSPLVAVLQSGPGAGTLVFGTDGGFVYSPALGQTMPGVFSYLVFNDVGGVASASVTVTVGNLPPVVGDDKFVGAMGSALTVPSPGLLANDSDPDMDGMAASLLTQASNGIVTVSPAGGFTYIPNAAFVGVDSFTYRVTDSRGAWSDGECKIRVMTAVPAESMSIVTVVSPNPVRSGEPLTITAEVTHSWSLMPDFDFVRRVETEPMTVGLVSPVELSFHSWVNTDTSKWQVVLPSPVLPYGLLEVTAKATAHSLLEARDRERFVAYTAPAVHVGVGQTHATILAGIQAVSSMGAVIIHPGTYSGAGNTMLPGVDCVVAGIGGRDVTLVDCVGVESIFAFEGSQSPMAWTDNAILMGMSVFNASNSAIHIKAGVTFFRMSVRDNAAPNNGAGFMLWHYGANSVVCRIVESAFDRNVAGSLAPTQTGASGGAYYGHGLGIMSFHLHDSEFRGNKALSSGGVDAGVGTATIVSGCLFEDNVARGSHYASTGAIQAIGYVGDSVFRRNKSESVPNPAASQPGGGSRAGALLTGLETVVFNCLFEDNSTSGVTGATGGAVHLQGCGTAVVFDQCRFLRNSASSGAGCRGGAVGGNYEAPRMRADHCVFIDNTATSTSASSEQGGGGAIGFAISAQTIPVPAGASAYYGAHHCLFTGNSTVGPLTGNCIYVKYEGILFGSSSPLGFMVEVVGCTLAHNQGGSHAIRVALPSLVIKNTIVFASENPVSWTGNAVTYGTSLSIHNSNLHPVLPAAFVGINGNISLDPLFVSVPGVGDHFLSQGPGQAVVSPCVNTGGQGISSWPMLFGLTTSTTMAADFGTVDMGYHYFPPGTPVVPWSPHLPSHYLALYPCAGTPAALVGTSVFLLAGTVAESAGDAGAASDPGPIPPGPCG